jgi:hypothetical protein
VQTALTGSLGNVGGLPGQLQLGGPPLISSWVRPGIPTEAQPLLAHAYLNDGVTAPATTATFPIQHPILSRPSLKATTTNGGQDKITLEVPAPVAGLVTGNVVRLTEVGSPFAGFVYGGIVEALPDTVSSAGTKHEITLTPFGIELTRVYSQALYAQATDVGQAVRDAVALTKHCSCDQASVPVATGILLATTSGGQVDFRNQTVQQVLDTCRSIAGPTWYWYCDELGRVWFQPMGSATVYTITQAQYEERISNGGSIESCVNQVASVGGVPTGGSANITGLYNGSSQSTLGVRSLNPPLSVPNITDQAALNQITASVGAVLDRVWNRIQVKTTPVYTQRIHQSQPGGAMVRIWEPAKTPLPESEAGTGYSGPYVVQEIDYDGLHQLVVGGDIPVTSQTDVTNMVASLVARAAANSVQVTAAALNLQQQVMTGTVQSGTGTSSSSGGGTLQAALWALSQREFAAYDPNGVTRVEMGNLLANGISPAQWGFRANDASGNPLFDSLGLISVMASLGAGNGSGNVSSSTFAGVGGTPVSFSLSRPANMLALFLGQGSIATEGGAKWGNLRANLLGISQSGAMAFGNAVVTEGMAWHYVPSLAAGSYTWQLDVSSNDNVTIFACSAASIQVFQIGQ